MAEWTGLEPATSGVTGQHSNQLNYHSALKNSLVLRIQAWSLHLLDHHVTTWVVGAEGFEPPTLSV